MNHSRTIWDVSQENGFSLQLRPSLSAAFSFTKSPEGGLPAAPSPVFSTSPRGGLPTEPCGSHLLKGSVFHLSRTP